MLENTSTTFFKRLARRRRDYCPAGWPILPVVAASRRERQAPASHAFEIPDTVGQVACSRLIIGDILAAAFSV
jgi:hypothetical protein